MNVLIITRWFPSDRNNYLGIFVQQQALAISSFASVTVIYIDVDYSKFNIARKKDFSVEYVNDNYRVIRLIYAHSLPIYNQVNFIWSSVLDILKIIRGSHFDIIHAHVIFQAGIVSSIISRCVKVPMVVTEHSNWGKSYFSTFIHKLFSYYVLARSNRVISVSNYSRKLLRLHHSRTIDVIYNHVNDIPEYSADLKANSTEINIGFLGGLNTDIKGLDILINAVKLCSDLNIKLHIGGSGRLLNYYEKMAEESLTANSYKFYGEIIPSEKSQFFNSLDFFILPSRTESFGIVLIESLVYGKPVIATLCGGPEEIITHDVGILVKKEDISALELGIRTMANSFNNYSPDLMRKYVLDNFGEEIFKRRIMQLYGQTIKSF